ncbi:MAG: Eco57I restriction-modification methylase domain-containing protein [Candidatus Scalindua sp.]|nr:Eco57I restriction-modification methylase domain-containing protein [Candidatus Scalindua sp.]
MEQRETKLNIKAAIEKFQKGNLTDNSLSLFKAFGYNTERQQPFEKKTYAYFKEFYLDSNSRFNEDKALVSQWNYIDLLFQLSRDEISPQLGLFDTKQVDRTIIETYLFFVIELCEESYSRTALSQITREINKVFPMPAMVLLKHGNTLTLSVINRRLHQRDEQKDVLEKVTHIKDISTEKPHRAHIEILFDLSFDELLRIHKFSNFVELHKAWQKTLDIKELNKRFYKELSNWYFWAMHNVYFPGAYPDADDKSIFKNDEKVREHNAKNLIRLLTRILFIWFTKEKNLIPDELFDESFIRDNLLKSFEPRRKDVSGPQSHESKYYRAILQNLFFATLNQTVGKREFRKGGQHMNVTNLMRYESYFKDRKIFLDLVEKTVPFMNGGLFECIDKPSPDLKGKKGGDFIIYEDGFSDRPDNELCVPDYIFFGTSEHADLSEELGDKSKDVEVKGLLNILKSYKFTITENTPIEEDIALDPELLGKVFENLLASYNPETRTTARKQTGSFYTPPEIVNYMVDESLIAYLRQRMDDAGIKDKETDLRDMIGYSENPNPFSAEETAILIEAIDTCKILDPACGSGAFPMGILHKLVHILDKLDPKNELWKEKQIQKASMIDDVAILDQLIEDIEAAFNNNELDYGRKLYLIENCIYGVDIQPIASQISKLRCFISLIVDERIDKTKDNFGVRPLPNLETKFVAANTLIRLEKPKGQLYLNNPEINKLEEQIKDVRHRLFNAKTPVTKRKLREDDKTLREKMGDLLVDCGWRNNTARQLASWDPYDQNASSPFFDPEWMFGITDGFDLVIGNPPYLRIQGIYSASEELLNYYKLNFKSATGRFDLYCLFTEKGYQLAKTGGQVNYIMPFKWTNASFGKGLRSYLSENQAVEKMISFSDFQVFTASTYSSLLWLSKTPKEDFDYIKLDRDLYSEKELNFWLGNLKKCNFAQINFNQGSNVWQLISNNLKAVFQKLDSQETKIADITDGVYQGIVTGDNKVFVLTVITTDANYFNCYSEALKEEFKIEKTILHPLVTGKEISKFCIKQGEKVILYPYQEHNGKTVLIGEAALKLKYPLAYSYLQKNYSRLLNRGSKSMKYPSWYALWNPRKMDRLSAHNKILTPDVCYTPQMWLDANIGFYHIDTSYAIITKPNFATLIFPLYAILNSTLMWFYLKNTGAVLRGGFFRFKTSYLENFPIPKPDLLKTQIETFKTSVLLIEFCNKLNNLTRDILYDILNALVFNLYFPNHMKERNIDVLQFVEKDIAEVMQDKEFDTLNNSQKEQVIAELHKRWSDPNSEILKRMNSFTKKSPEILKPIIEG